MDTYHTSPTGSSIREGFTMIELIFVIIVIGILASVAMSKLYIVRNDAKLSADVSNMNLCIRNASARYMATKIADLNIASCNNVICYTIDINESIMNVDVNPSAANFCSDIENVGGNLVNSYQFAGQGVNR